MDSTIPFKSRECKLDNHKSCPGQWIGFGFKIICSVSECHKNNEKVKTSAGVWEPEANVVEQSSSFQERTPRR